MDAQEEERLARWFWEHWRHGPCPVCQAESWSPQGELGQIENLDTGLPTPMPGGGFVIQRGRVPVALVTCMHCGYMVAANALVAGIRRANADEDTE